MLTMLQLILTYTYRKTVRVGTVSETQWGISDPEVYADPAKPP